MMHVLATLVIYTTELYELNVCSHGKPAQLDHNCGRGLEKTFDKHM